MHGIISLSESPDNLLMWSHYADEHRGIVVEFEVDEYDPFDLFETNTPPKYSDAKFGRVSYRKSRKYPYDINEESINSIRDYYYLSKSDEWIYEKEHRFITPFTLVNSIHCNTNNLNWKRAFQAAGLTIPKNISSTIVKAKMIPPIGGLLPAWFHSHNTGAVFLVNVNSKRINKIILGANTDKREFLSVMKEYECHIQFKSYYCSFSNKFKNVEQAKLDPDRYELIFNHLE